MFHGLPNMLSFNVAERLGFPKSAGPSMGKVPPDLIADLAGVIDALSEQSAIVRQLKTEYEDNRLPKLQSSEDTVYVIAEDCDILGFVRVGVRSIKISTSDSAKATKWRLCSLYRKSQRGLSVLCVRFLHSWRLRSPRVGDTLVRSHVTG